VLIAEATLNGTVLRRCRNDSEYGGDNYTIRYTAVAMGTSVL